MPLVKKSLFSTFIALLIYLIISKFHSKNIIFGQSIDHTGGFLWWLWLNKKLNVFELIKDQDFTNYPMGENNNSYLYITTLIERFLGLIISKLTDEFFAYNSLLILSFLVAFWSVVFACMIITPNYKIATFFGILFILSNISFAYGTTNFNYLFTLIGIPAFLYLSKNIESNFKKNIILASIVIGMLNYIDGYGSLFIYVLVIALFTVTLKNINSRKIKNFLLSIFTIFAINLPALFLYLNYRSETDLPLRSLEEGDRFQLTLKSFFFPGTINNILNSKFESDGLFFGYLILVLIILNFLFLLLAKNKNAINSEIWILILFISIVSLGPYFKIFNFELSNIFVRLFPFNDHIRVYNRVQIYIVLLIILIFYSIVTRIHLKKITFFSLIIFVSVSLGLDLYSRKDLPLYFKSDEIPGAYLWLKDKKDSFIVADLSRKTPDNEFLRYQSTHGKKMINSIYETNLSLMNSLGVYDKNTGCILQNVGVNYAIWHGNSSQLEQLKSMNDMRLVMKFDNKNVSSKTYRFQTEFDDGSSAIFKIVKTDKSPKFLVIFKEGFEEVNVNNNLGIWSNNKKSIIEFHKVGRYLKNESKINFVATLYALKESKIRINQDDNILWMGEIGTVGTKVNIKIDLNYPLNFYVDSLYSPSDLNINSSDRRKLGFFITDYTDSIC